MKIPKAVDFSQFRPIIENWKTIKEYEAQLSKRRPEGSFTADLSGADYQLFIRFKYRSFNKARGEYIGPHKEVLVPAYFCPFTGRPLYRKLANPGQIDIEDLINDSTEGDIFGNK